MDKSNFGQIVSFLFGIANDCLVDTYDVGDYRKIISANDGDPAVLMQFWNPQKKKF